MIPTPTPPSSPNLPANNVAQKKRRGSSVFTHLLIRLVVSLSLVSLMLLAVVLPYFEHTTTTLAAEQGKSLTNSTISAVRDDLYQNNMSDVILYCRGVLKNTPSIHFIVFSKSDGEQLLITASQWNLSQNQFRLDRQTLEKHPDGYFEKRWTQFANIRFHNIDREMFLFSNQILLGSDRWNAISIGYSLEEYNKVANSFKLGLSALILAFFALTLLLFRQASNSFRKKLGAISQTTSQLANGNFHARVRKTGFSEMDYVGDAINSMAASLHDKTHQLAQFSHIIKQTNEAFLLFNAEMNVIFANDATATLTGYPVDQLMGLRMTRFCELLELDPQTLLADFDWDKAINSPPNTRDLAIKCRSGEEIFIASGLEVIVEHDEAPNHSPSRNLLLVMADITSRKRLENELHRLAYVDLLTDLPNRRMFMRCIEKLVDDSGQEGTSFALLFMDLKDFKNINDSLGHEIGDLVLQQIANILKAMFPYHDMMSRLGGDEFTILLTEIGQQTSLQERSERVSFFASNLLQQLASRPMIINGNFLSIGSSIGAAIYPEHGDDASSLLRSADTALYAAKRHGLNRFLVFDEEMNKALQEQVQLDSEMRRGLMATQKHFFLNYQPIVRLSDMKIVGAEALARWKNPRRGMISPGEFIPLAEKSELIVELSQFLFEQALKQMQKWQQTGVLDYVSINISVKHFELPDFVEKLMEIMSQYCVAPEKMLLEFTESIMLENIDEALVKLEQLKKYGFRIAIDDFGTGYSSLNYIHQLPIDCIKIDKSFIDGIPDNRKTQAIIQAVSTIAGSLDIWTVAEGVESPVQSKWLKKYGCSCGQGYLFSRPISPEELEKLVQNTNLTETVASA